MNTGIETLPVVFASTTDAALVRREVREGRLRRVDRGTYLHIDSARAGWQQAEDVIRARCLGLQQRCRGGTVVSHATAALLHGLPVPTSRILDVSHSFLRATRTEAAFPVTRHIRELTEEDVVTLDGVLVTSLERTVIDCACALRSDWALAVADAALRQCARVDRRHRAGRGTSIDDLRSSWLELLERSGPRRGRVQARAVLGLCDPLAESAGESRARCVFLADGLPPPLLQAPIGLEGGTAFSDFAWALDDSGRMLHGEYDGLGKYTSPSTAAESGKASIDRPRPGSREGLGRAAVRVPRQAVDQGERLDDDGGQPDVERLRHPPGPARQAHGLPRQELAHRRRDADPLGSGLHRRPLRRPLRGVGALARQELVLSRLAGHDPRPGL